MTSSTSTVFNRIVAVTILLLTTLTMTIAGQFCNVCRDPPSGGFRDLATPRKSFTLPNGNTFTFVYVDPNPACRLCSASNLDNRALPPVNYGSLTNTGSYGNMNCQGLEMASQEGVFPPSACGESKWPFFGNSLLIPIRVCHLYQLCGFFPIFGHIS
jgi:hypothetical protein